MAKEDRGQWSGKLAFVLAAAGSAVGLGNIWKFPSEVAQNGGAAFLLIYLVCCFLVGFPLMCAELAIGRHTAKDPVGAFRSLAPRRPAFALIGGWGVLCGVMILSFYSVVAGWTFSGIFGELFRGLGNAELAAWFEGATPGLRGALFAVAFIVATIVIVAGGVRGGIERATKTMMPALVVILLIMIAYVVGQEGAREGLARYLKPDFSLIDANLVFQAMGQAFFSLSLGMGAMITYGSYLGKKQNLAQAAVFVTLADVGIAFLAGLLIMPAMFVALHGGVEIFDDAGNLLREDALIFQVLPNLFESMGSVVGMIFGVSFFVLLSMAALTSTISLLEVPVAYAVDELGAQRKKAAWVIGGSVGTLSAVIAFKPGLIGLLATIFSDVGLPLGGLAILLFLAWVWRTDNAMAEMRQGFEGVDDSFFGKAWPPLVKYVCPILILIVLGTILAAKF
ncbi:MAG: sodium-dependent transporter [Acidobacteria bacterium]|nr:MAG: sodium-dependent transporter [Acidobacteriota bacterium]